MALFSFFLPQVDAAVQGGDETECESDDSAGFEIFSPDPSRVCRVIRGRRYRPVRTAHQCAKKARPFGGVTYTIEITEVHQNIPVVPEATESVAVAIDVTVSGGSLTTSCERHYGYLKNEGGASISFCPVRLGFGNRLGSMRGGASPEKEQAADDAEQETASNNSFKTGRHGPVSTMIDTLGP